MQIYEGGKADSRQAKAGYGWGKLYRFRRKTIEVERIENK